MNKNLVSVLLIIASIAILGGTYWVFRQGKTVPVATSIQESKTLENNSAMQQEKATNEQKTQQDQLQPIAKTVIAKVTDSGQNAIAPVETVASQLPISAGQESKKSELTATSKPMPLPNDPLLASLLPQKDMIRIPLLAAESTSPYITQDMLKSIAETGSPLKTAISKPESMSNAPVQEIEPIAPTTSVANSAGTMSGNEPTSMDVKKPEVKAETIPSIAKENTSQINLAISFFDKQLDTFSKGWGANLDFVANTNTLSFGGSLELGMISDTPNRFYASILGKGIWNLGKGDITFPISLALGPTLFYDSTNSITWGASVQAMAGIQYILTDSFSLFASTGITYQLEIPSMTNHWIAVPLRIGIGFRL
ncbi:hypothetical protein [uncultured Sphaerochaeta sp.]|uniref:hypothetical protein n=1 Tax=uncultured Sphaerochaeta sp. TaxID=886478 RepID=UPI002A0A10EF|nr:hypothetical protein [uncultured Sphaerochaeta sp.]